MGISPNCRSVLVQPNSERLEKTVRKAICGFSYDDLQDGNGIVAEGVHLWFPCLLEGRWVTPAVVVEGKEVASLIIGSAVKIMSGLDTVFVYSL